jgi:pimeloyl-ACP methyl ester carboxylesterase
VRHLRGAVTAIDGPVVVCAHSYGGATMTEAFSDPANVVGLVYLAAFLLEAGETPAGLAATNAPDPAFQPRLDDGYLSVSKNVASQVFYNDCSAEDVEWASDRVTPEHLSSLDATITAAAWQVLPTTYIKTSRDRALSPVLQEAMASRVEWRAEIDSDHSPMLSHAQDCARLLAQAYRRHCS